MTDRLVNIWELYYIGNYIKPLNFEIFNRNMNIYCCLENKFSLCLVSKNSNHDFAFIEINPLKINENNNRY